MEKIKVFLSDPQVLFREGIHFTLSGEDDFEVTGESTSNEEAYSFIESNPPNIAILNINDGKTDGCTVTRRIKRNFPSISVVLVTNKDEEEELFNAIKCGASACINKDTDPDYLMDTTRVIAQGGQPLIEKMLEPTMAANILAEFEKMAPISEQLNNLLARLSPKEAEVLSMLTGGNTIEQITIKMNNSEAGIRRQLKLIVNKLVANDQAKAVIEATQRGLPGLISSATSAYGVTNDYVTKDEFNDFKDNLIQRLRSLMGELTS